LLSFFQLDSNRNVTASAVNMQGERFLEGRGEGTMRSLRPSARVMQMRQAKALPIEVGCAGASVLGVLKSAGQPGFPRPKNMAMPDLDGIRAPEGVEDKSFARCRSGGPYGES